MMRRSTAIAGVAGAATGIVLLSCLAFAMQPSVDAGQGPTPSATLTPSAEPSATPSPLPTVDVPSTPPAIVPNDACEDRALATAEDGSCVDPSYWDDMPSAWVPPCTDWIADHGGICKGEPITWGLSSGDTLVCGQDAKPALDYREDDIGWWAYCEPALVTQ